MTTESQGNNVTTVLYGTYLPEEDKTVVWRATYRGACNDHLTSEIVGWYCGEPSDELNQQYSHGGEDLIAHYD